MGQIISVWLCMSPCRSDYIFTALFHGVRRIVSEDSGCAELCLEEGDEPLSVGLPDFLLHRQTRNVRIQPFLLIVRTGWIFTAHARTLGTG